MGSKHDSRSDEIRVFLIGNAAYLFGMWSPNMTCANLTNSCTGAWPSEHLCWLWSRNLTRAKEMKYVKWPSIWRTSVLILVTKHDFWQIKDLLYWLSSYSLNTLFMGAKHDSGQSYNLVYSIQPTFVKYRLKIMICLN